jgi:hypothetical protein
MALYRVAVAEVEESSSNSLHVTSDDIVACPRWVWAADWESAAKVAISGSVTISSSSPYTFSTTNVTAASNATAGSVGTPFILTDQFYEKIGGVPTLQDGRFLALEDRYSISPPPPDYDYDDEHWELDIQIWNVETGEICFPCLGNAIGTTPNTSSGTNADGVSATGQTQLGVAGGGTLSNKGGGTSTGSGVSTDQAQLIALDTKDNWDDPQTVLLTQNPVSESFDRVGVDPGNSSLVLYAPNGVAAAGKEQLIHDTTGDTYTLIAPDGRQFFFNGLGETAWGCITAGQLDHMTTADGVTAQNTFDGGTGQLTDTQTPMDETGDGLQNEHTDYVSSGENEGLRETVTEQVSDDGGSGWTTTRISNYTYYETTDTHGTRGDVATVIVTDGDANVVEQQAFRYYIDDTSGGYAHAVKMSFGTRIDRAADGG